MIEDCYRNLDEIRRKAEALKYVFTSFLALFCFTNDLV